MADSFDDVSPEADLASIGDASLVLLADDGFMLATVETPRARLSGSRLYSVRFHAERGGERWSGRVDAPRFATPSTLALPHGLQVRRAVLLPGIRWRPLLAPEVDLGKGRDVRPREAAAEIRRLPVSDRSSRIVDEVADEYARLLTDLTYHITNSALFDSTVATTYEFDRALLAWQDLPVAAPAGERAELAALVRLTFATARAHAELVGLDHVPAEFRGRASRAAKAASLAERATSAPEREAALDQVGRILVSLGLYYLPAPPPRALPRLP
ncbi:hypothetical protein BW730_09090 [Tessaracoccus aquimaris]|uniref:Uncharacterized protein n=1 Tax=Tessaracoccus aquimaris TaxID=1332264 RepID=A0A1Q2CND5_9ACTN|nr:hypothetical protein [Tessaracoccus aquimaris]AQP47626.1 hypothetical protein BW730_09090 [Tessaracoccus aquimaris]